MIGGGGQDLIFKPNQENTNFLLPRLSSQEVYTEDIRYVDKHAQELKRSKESHARMVNLLVVKKVRMARGQLM